MHRRKTIPFLRILNVAGIQRRDSEDWTFKALKDFKASETHSQDFLKVPISNNIRNNSNLFARSILFEKGKIRTLIALTAGIPPAFLNARVHGGIKNSAGPAAHRYRTLRTFANT